MLSSTFDLNLEKNIQEIKILKFHFATMKASLCFSVSKCLQILWNPSSEPEIWGFLKYSRVREHFCPRSIPRALVTKHLPDRLWWCQEVRKATCVAVQHGGWVGSKLHYIFRRDILILCMWIFPLKMIVMASSQTSVLLLSKMCPWTGWTICKTLGAWITQAHKVTFCSKSWVSIYVYIYIIYFFWKRVSHSSFGKPTKQGGQELHNYFGNIMI